MSSLRDFINGVQSSARDLIGTDDFSIGSGSVVKVVSAEPDYGRESISGGFDRDNFASVVLATKDFELAYPSSPTSYLGKLCTYKDGTWRIDKIRKGNFFVTLELINQEQSS